MILGFLAAAGVAARPAVHWGGMLEGLQFSLRRRLLGRLIMRRGVPRLQAADQAPGEHAYYKLLLSAATTSRERQRVGKVVDVGCRNWSYLPGLAAALPHAEFVGVELDGYRRYWNMYRRIDYARAHAAAVPNAAEVRLGDFLAQPVAPPARGDLLFCFFFPFVTPRPCRAWGLPPRYADYAALLTHALRLGEGVPTRYVCVHQGDLEAAEAERVYQRLGIAMRAKRLEPSRWAGLWSSPHDNWVFSGAPRP